MVVVNKTSAKNRIGVSIPFYKNHRLLPIGY